MLHHTTGNPLWLEISSTLPFSGRKFVIGLRISFMFLQCSYIGPKWDDIPTHLAGLLIAEYYICG
jgi:hypothetical protein